MEKLTELKIKALKPHEKEYYLREQNGFVLRIRPSGSKSFYYIYDYGGKRQRLSLGSWPAVSLADARQAHSEAWLRLQRGEDPKPQQPAAVEETPAETPENLTIAQLKEKWCAWSEKHHSAKWYNTLKWALEKDIIPDYGQRLSSEIRRRDAVALLEKKAATAPGQAANLLKALRGMYQYAVERELVEFNPFSEIRAARTIPSMKQTARERILSEVEIKYLWTTIDQGGDQTVHNGRSS